MKIKTFIYIFITALCLCVSPVFGQTEEEIPVNVCQGSEFIKTSSIKISEVDPTPENNPLGAFYPGFRGNNQLIIYTSKFGEYTNTNEFGKEAIVVGGKIFGFGGSNSYIPKNGFVISGHGAAKKWMNENLMEGATVKIDYSTMRLESTITPESYLYKAGQRINTAKKIIMDYKKILPGYEYKISENYLKHAFQQYNRARYMLEKQRYQEGKELSNKALNMAEMAFYYAIPAVKNELHGVWIRPVEKNRKEIEKTVKKLAKTGIDNIFLETYYHGCTVFPSKTMVAYGLNAQNPEFKGWDPLKIWLDEAHKNNIKVHIWFQTFYIGNDDINTTPKHMLALYPEWANVQKKNSDKTIPMPSVSEHNGYFLDPANPNVQKFLLSLLNEIITEYDVDGLNIDYIRYPKSLSSNIIGYLNSTWGYSEFARKEFNTLYGEDPINLEKDNPLMEKWDLYRQSKVTGFVSKIKPMVGERNIMVSTVIFPNYKETLTTKMQNWPLWGQNNYVDAFTPLIMSSDMYIAGKSIKEIRNLSGDTVNIFPGLFEPFTSGNPFDLLAQISSVRIEGSSGIIIFDNAHLNDEFINALSARILRKD